ncbi:TIGR02679 family protein [Streptomyces sp. NPDC088251]|uniref:TIGR02679 family protein n=1 Tax=unclassified Streptomyces TaxID=2593676 RepID=UPI0037FF1D61
MRAEEEEKRLREELADQETTVIDTGRTLREALDRPEVLNGAGLDRSSLPDHVSDNPGSDVRDRLRALRSLAGTVEQALGRSMGEVSDDTLLKRHTALRDQLAGGYDAQLEERDGIKVCRLLDDHGSHDVAVVGERIATQSAEARGRLTERESEVFQRFLTGELGDHLSGLPPATRDWLAGPGLARLWSAVRKRLEGNGVQPIGSLRLTAVSAQERNDLSLLLGKPLTGTAVTVRLDALDARLRTSAAELGLREVLEELGPPLVDRRAAREDDAAQRRHVWASLASSLDASPLAGQEWTRQWYDVLRRTGVPRGVTPEAAVRTLQQAVQVLTVLLDPERTGTRGRGELAATATGSAHGLDDGAWLARLVHRGVALAHDTDLPTNAAGRRALWRLVSVTPDEISSTVLTYGLRPTGEGWREQSLRERAAHHAETHLTPRDLLDLSLQLPAGTTIHICENPRVVEAAADAACAKPLVCTSGSAATVVLTLLDALAATGCRFAYHGDFDRPGIALANRIIRRYEALPWRMGAEDYERLAAAGKAEGVPQLPLDGRPVDADWDQGLAPAMTALGVALHEEATLDLLVGDLSVWT